MLMNKTSILCHLKSYYTTLSFVTPRYFFMHYVLMYRKVRLDYKGNYKDVKSQHCNNYCAVFSITDGGNNLNFW